MNNEPQPQRQFSEEQLVAINLAAPHILCSAGPGSGKSTVLVARIKRLIADGVPPERIAALSFTNAAANVLQERLGPTHLGANSTLHSFALRSLKEHGGGMGYGARTALVSPESTRDLLESKARSLGSRTPIDKLLELKASIRRTTGAERRSVDETAIASYLEEMRFAGIVDFDAILTEFLHLLHSPDCGLKGRFDHILIDEVQDSAPIDWAIYRALPIPNKFMVGDDCQSIFSFRGAAVAEMMAEAQAPGTRLIRLEANYRSREEICEAANRLIAHNQQRLEKRTISTRGPGGTVDISKPLANEGQELAELGTWIKTHLTAGTSPQEIAVLCRTNAQVNATSRTLAAWDLPVEVREQAKLPKDWPAVRAFVEHLVQPDNDTLAFLWLVAREEHAGRPPAAARATAHRIRQEAQQAGEPIGGRLMKRTYDINQAVRWLEPFSLEARMLVAEHTRGLPADATMLDFALALAGPADPPEAEKKPVIAVSTVHGFKGKEADVVFVLGLEDEGWPGRRKDENIEESRRLFYVAVTRARERLYLSHASSRVVRFGNFEKIESRTPSRFIKEILP